jgi:hypothetical protein
MGAVGNSVGSASCTKTTVGPHFPLARGDYQIGFEVET